MPSRGMYILQQSRKKKKRGTDSSTSCKHSYSAEAIYGLIEQSRGRSKRAAMCPMPGCKTQVTRDTLKVCPPPF